MPFGRKRPSTVSACLPSSRAGTAEEWKDRWKVNDLPSYYKGMKNDAGGHRVLKTTISVVAAALVVAAAAGISALAWKAQGRSAEDVSYARWTIVSHEARVAKSLMPMIDRLETLRGQVGSLRPGTAEYDAYNHKLTDLQNVIADAMPALVFRRDAAGNATLVGVEMARAHLQARIDLAARGRE